MVCLLRQGGETEAAERVEEALGAAVLFQDAHGGDVEGVAQSHAECDGAVQVVIVVFGAVDAGGGLGLQGVERGEGVEVVDHDRVGGPVIILADRDRCGGPVITLADRDRVGYRDGPGGLILAVTQMTFRLHATLAHPGALSV